MRIRLHLALRIIVCATLLSSHSTLAQFSQQGPKLRGAGAVGGDLLGVSASLSADGNTAIVGGTGAGAWVWTRSGGVWTQQGSRLVGSGAVGSGLQGLSVALSADGNTAIVGAPYDNSGAGTAWVWTRNGGVWTQQGSKLVGSGAIQANQGRSVALSADGNTAIVGGSDDNRRVGAAWVWTRSGGVWTQQGAKLVGSGAAGGEYWGGQQGYSVALSADGNTAIVGSLGDNGYAGAAWVWTRSGGAWTQQGTKLVGSDALGNAAQGASVALSADGNTAIVGGPGDADSYGAAWVWTRSGGVWTQHGQALVGLGGAWNREHGVEQGYSVAISGDGNTVIVGGPAHNDRDGATWVWTRSGEGWIAQETMLVGSDAAGPAVWQGCSVALSADGSTALVGGYGDNNNEGAAWVFARAVPRRRHSIRR